MKAQTAKKSKIAKSIVSIAHEENIYHAGDITFILNTIQGLGKKTSRNTLIDWAVRGYIGSARDSESREIVELFFKMKVKMCREFNKQVTIKYKNDEKCL